MGRILICMVLLLTTAVPSRAAVVRLIEDAPGNYRLEGEQLEGVAAKLSDSSGQPFAVRTEYQLSNSTGAQTPAETLPLQEQESEPPAEELPQEQLSEPTAEEFPLEQVVTPPATTSQGGPMIATEQLDLPPGDEKTAPPDEQPGNPPEPYLVPLLEEIPPAPAEAESSRRPTQPYIEKQKHTVVATLRRFEEYAGPRTLTQMAVLFRRASTEPQQRPEILLADGKTSAEVEFAIKHGKKPSVALRNARLLWTKAVAEGRFIVRCTPKEGALSVKILYLGGEEIIEIPLTVAPPISLTGIEVQRDEPLPRLDLDGDGESTWRDDYILVANLLAQEKPVK